MAGLMARTSEITKAKFSKLLDHAENPEETLDYAYEQQLQQLQNVKRGIADVTTAKNRLQLEESSTKQQIAKLDDQAKQALSAGREDLAREALTRKASIQAQLDGIAQQEAQLADQQQKLIAAEQALQTKVESFRSQKEVIKAQYSAAEAQVKIGEAATGIGEHMADVGLAVQRAQEKTQDMQARANAIDELTAAGALDDPTAQGDDLDRQLSQISQGNQVDDELAKLKAELGQGTAPAQLAEAPATPEPPATGGAR
jgi:phage shock protein A